MENNNEFKTYFLTPFDVKNYMSILGAIVIVDDAFILDGLLCCVDKNNSIFVITPPVAALLTSKVLKKECVLFKKEGMEAMFKLDVEEIPGIVAIHDNKKINAENNMH